MNDLSVTTIGFSGTFKVDVNIFTLKNGTGMSTTGSTGLDAQITPPPTFILPGDDEHGTSEQETSCVLHTPVFVTFSFEDIVYYCPTILSYDKSYVQINFPMPDVQVRKFFPVGITVVQITKLTYQTSDGSGDLVLTDPSQRLYIPAARVIVQSTKLTHSHTISNS